jgi:BirA family biotin operon repressor/biotin-[acetyl-CoA-carboxylase] ligase
VRVVQADGELVGRATAVADDGSLVVATAGGEVTVSAGDVVHLRPARD